MPKYITEQRIYLDAKDEEEALERLRKLEHEGLNYPWESMTTKNPPQLLQEDGSLAPHDSPASHELGGRPALLVGNALVPQDSITGVKLYPGAVNDPEQNREDEDLDELADPVAIDIYTTAGIAFFEHGSRAGLLIQKLGLNPLLRHLTKQKMEKDYDPS